MSQFLNHQYFRKTKQLISKIYFIGLKNSKVKSKLYLYFNFTVKKSEIECLIRIFHNVVGRGDVKLANVGLDRNTFRVILHSIFGMTDDVLMNRGKESWRLKWAKLRWQVCVGVCTHTHIYIYTHIFSFHQRLKFFNAKTINIILVVLLIQNSKFDHEDGFYYKLTQVVVSQLQYFEKEPVMN